MKKFVLSLGVLGLTSIGTRAWAGEVLTDRCSGDVAIVNWGDAPNSGGHTLILHRDSSGYTQWTQPFSVNLSSDGFVRWWCHSETGNWADPGTWEIREVQLGVQCDMNANDVQGCLPNPQAQISNSVWNGWTAERSRCDSHSNRFMARLGPDRLLQMVCQDNSVGVSTSALGYTSGPTTCHDAVQGNIAWDYNNDRTWQDSNIATLCGTAANSEQPAWCFDYVMFGGVNWGGGTRWDWTNAVNLCQSATSAVNRVDCFEYILSLGNTWEGASGFCVQNS